MKIILIILLLLPHTGYAKDLKDYKVGDQYTFSNGTTGRVVYVNAELEQINVVQDFPSSSKLSWTEKLNKHRFEKEVGSLEGSR